MLVLRLGVSDTYVGGAAGRLIEIMVATLQRVFPRVRAVAGENILLLGGMAGAELTFGPEEVAARWRRRVVEDPVFVPEKVPLLVDEGRTATLQAFVDAAQAPANTSDHPRAVLLAMGLAEGRSEGSLLTLARRLEGRSPGPLLAAVAVLCGLLLILARRGRGVAGTASARGVMKPRQLSSTSRSLARPTSMSIMPCSTRNSLRWNPSGSVWRIVCSMTRGPANPISARGSAMFRSPSMAKEAVTPPVVGSVRIEM